MVYDLSDQIPTLFRQIESNVYKNSAVSKHAFFISEDLLSDFEVDGEDSTFTASQLHHLRHTFLGAHLRSSNSAALLVDHPLTTRQRKKNKKQQSRHKQSLHELVDTDHAQPRQPFSRDQKHPPQAFSRAACRLLSWL